MSPTSPRTLAPPASQLGHGLVLVLLFAAALALRIREAAGAPLWFDEIYLVLVGRHPWHEVLRLMAADIHPPVYPLLLHAWMHLGGEHEVWLKSASVALGLASIALTYALGRRLWSARAGMVAAALLAFDGAHLHFSQEVEVYPLLWVLALGVVYFGAGWVERRRPRDAVGLVVCATVGAYTHYLVLAVLAVTAAWGVLRLRREPRALLAWLGLLALVALLFAPQMPVIARQFVREGAGRYFHWPTLEGLANLGRLCSLGATYLVPAFALLAVLALLDRARGPVMALPALLCVLLPFAVRAWPYVITRDLLVIAPLWILLAAAGLECLTWRRVGTWLTLALLVFAVRGGLRHQPFAESRALGRAVKVLAAVAPRGALVIHAETHSLLFFEYYRPEDDNLLLMPAGQHVPFFDAGLIVNDDWLISPERWAAARTQGRRWWGVHCDRAFVTRGVASRAGARPERMLDSLATGRRWSFPPVRVWEGVAGGPPLPPP